MTHNAHQDRPKMSIRELHEHLKSRATQWAVGTLEGVEQEFRVYADNNRVLFVEDENDRMTPKYLTEYFKRCDFNSYGWQRIGG